MTLTLGSLFDGIGGFPLAAIRQGITPLWASEIESFPIQVTKHMLDVLKFLIYPYYSRKLSTCQ